MIIEWFARPPPGLGFVRWINDPANRATYGRELKLRTSYFTDSEYGIEAQQIASQMFPTDSPLIQRIKSAQSAHDTLHATLVYTPEDQLRATMSPAAAADLYTALADAIGEVPRESSLGWDRQKYETDKDWMQGAALDLVDTMRRMLEYDLLSPSVLSPELCQKVIDTTLACFKHLTEVLRDRPGPNSPVIDLVHWACVGAFQVTQKYPEASADWISPFDAGLELAAVLIANHGETASQDVQKRITRMFWFAGSILTYTELVELFAEEASRSDATKLRLAQTAVLWMEDGLRISDPTQSAAVRRSLLLCGKAMHGSVKDPDAGQVILAFYIGLGLAKAAAEDHAFATSIAAVPVLPTLLNACRWLLDATVDEADRDEISDGLTICKALAAVVRAKWPEPNGGAAIVTSHGFLEVIARMSVSPDHKSKFPCVTLLVVLGISTIHPDLRRRVHAFMPVMVERCAKMAAAEGLDDPTKNISLRILKDWIELAELIEFNGGMKQGQCSWIECKSPTADVKLACPRCSLRFCSKPCYACVLAFLISPDARSAAWKSFHKQACADTAKLLSV